MHASDSSLTRRLHAILPANALGLHLIEQDTQHLVLGAPLALNLNDKGNAFGGSLASAMTLAGWALMTARLTDAGHAADVYVQTSQIRYLAPLYEDIRAEARLGPGQDWETVLAIFAARGKVRAWIEAEVREAGGRLCCCLEAAFVALRPTA